MVITFFQALQKMALRRKATGLRWFKIKGRFAPGLPARENVKIRFNFIGFWDETEKISRGPEK